jgi:transposase
MCEARLSGSDMNNTERPRRDFVALEQRRLDAVRLVEQGLRQTEVARLLKVSRQSVSRWLMTRRLQGEDALRGAGRAGRRPELTAEQRKTLRGLLAHEPRALGYNGRSWTSSRVAHLIQSRFGIAYHPGHVWKVLVALGFQRGSYGGPSESS